MISLKLIYRSSKYMILIYFLLSVISYTVPIINMYIFNLLVNALTDISEYGSAIIYYLVCYIASLLLIHTASRIISVVQNMIANKADNQFNVDITNKLNGLPLSFIDTSQGKDTIDNVRYTGGILCNFTFSIINTLLSIYRFIIIIVSLVIFNPVFTGVFLVLSIPGILLENYINNKTDIWRINSVSDVRKFSYYRWMLTDPWPAKDVRMYDLTDPIKKRYNEEKRNYLKQKNKLLNKGVTLSAISIAIKYIGIVVFTMFLILSASNGKLTVGEVTMYIGYASISTISFEAILLYYLNYKSYISKYFIKYIEFLSIGFDNIAHNGKNFQVDAFKSITLNNVWFTYPTTDLPVLKGVSFTLNKGETLSLVGLNGAGKSTIIKLLLRLYQPDSGEILLNGQPYEKYDIKEIRKLFSVMFQSFVEYPLTLRENIVLSDLSDKYNDDRIIRILRECGAWNDKFNDGLDTNMSREFSDTGVELSKGQWQKIALARTYYKNSPIIIFDEPSSAIDAEAEDKIFTEFNKLADNKTGIMISHRISSAKTSNKIIVLNDGKVEENGTHETLIKTNGLYAKLFNMQKEKYTLKEEVPSV